MQLSVFNRFVVVTLLACQRQVAPQEPAPTPLPTVAPPEEVAGTYELDAYETAKQLSDPRLVRSMHVTLRFEERGTMTKTTQTPYMKEGEVTHGRWRREGDDIVFTIQGDDTVCKRVSDKLVCSEPNRPYVPPVVLRRN